jgi:hypothetical protein
MNLIGPSYNLKRRAASVQRTINLVPVPIEPGNERTAWVFKDAPGMVQSVADDAWAIDPSLISSAVLTRRAPGGATWGDVSNAGRTYTFANNSSAWGSAWVRTGVAGTGKRYFEVVNVGPQVTNFYAGFMAHSEWNVAGYYIGTPLSRPSYLAHYGTLGGTTTGRMTNGVFAGDGSYTWNAGDVCQVAVDFDTGKVWYGKNGAWLGSGDPAAGTNNAQTLPSAEFDVYVGFYTLGTGTRVLTCNFNVADLVYAPPAGFSVLP